MWVSRNEGISGEEWRKIGIIETLPDNDARALDNHLAIYEQVTNL